MPLQAELRPLSCTGGKFDLVKIPYVTLIDTMDTLVVLGNHSEFKRVVATVSQALPSFEFDVNVSLFETTIRVLGGLISAHLMAVDPTLGIYVSPCSCPDPVLLLSFPCPDLVLILSCPCPALVLILSCSCPLTTRTFLREKCTNVPTCLIHLCLCSSHACGCLRVLLV